MPSIDDIREAAEQDLVTFIKLVSPNRVLGSVHEELCRWWNKEEAKSHQLTLLPRDHGKSAMVAYRVAWELTKDPTLRVLYISATSNLAQKQLSFIKSIFTSDIHRRYWPEHIHDDEGKREKWTMTEISLDHPKRKEEHIRDPSVFTGGLTTSLTGLHCDIAVLDDVVVYENAYTQEGRDRVKSQYSLLSSIEGADAREWVVGTRYHPKDLYSELLSMEEELYNKDGEITGADPIYEVFERAVEDIGDGTGQFLWPRQTRHDGKSFGFDIKVLAKKRAQYLDKTQFRAQYYNDPNDPDSRPIDYDKFQYYEKEFLTNTLGSWYYRERKLNVFAAVDFAYSLRKKADYTAIVVIGVDYENNVYVLDIDRFRTDKISEYFRHILDLLNKWDFKKIRAEVTAAQAAIVQELKDSYIKPHGLMLKVEEHRPTRHSGSKEERIAAILEPRYDNHAIYHYKGGNCQLLEEELVSRNPPHDDIKDALASAVEIAVRPSNNMINRRVNTANVIYSPRFGGIAH
jgi:phage terminase large subunit-like protein